MERDSSWVRVENRVSLHWIWDLNDGRLSCGVMLKFHQ